MEGETQATGTTSTATAGTEQAAQTAQAPTFQVPNGFRDYDEVVKYANLGKGSSPFYAKAKEVGFERGEDFERWAPFFKTVKARNLSPDFLRQVFDAEAAKERDGTQHSPDESGIDPRKLREDVKGEVLGEVRREWALKEHDSAMKRVPEALTKAVRAAFPDSSDYEVKRLVRELRAEIEDHREKNLEKHLYPEGHPLRSERYAVPAESIVAEIVESLRKERTEADGADKAKKADRIKAGTTTTTAGPQSGSGGPKGGGDRGSGGLPNVEKLMAAAQAKIAARGR